MRLKIGQLVDVELIREGWKGVYKTRVEDAEGDTLLLGMPYSFGKLVPLKPGEKVIITIKDQVAASRFVAKVEDVQDGTVAVFQIAQPKKVERLQRRSYVRVEIRRPCLFRLVSEDRYIETYTVDISGGGVRFSAWDKYKAGTKLALSIDFNTFKVECTGKVIRTVPASSNRFAVCVKFLDLDPKVRDKVVTWVFTYQLELRKKGLL